jgi:TrmH RNA methyltransferase
MSTWQKQRARELRSDMTEAERHLWEVLRQRQIEGCKFRRQQPLGRYIADFVCLEARIVIEVDGGHHGSEADAERDAWLSAQGFKVLRFWNDEVLTNVEGVHSIIEAALKKPSEPAAPSFSPWGQRKPAPAYPHPNPSSVKGEGLKSELRYYGLNAVQAVFAHRPDAIRKLYLSEARIPQLQPLLAWCVKRRIGYRVVGESDLGKLAASSHHEGVVADVLRSEPQALSTWLQSLPVGPVLALWLDGVGNPHNFGAILRSAAHFGVSAILQSQGSTLAVSGAAARVAEGGAEQVPLVRMQDREEALSSLRAAGFTLAATVVRGGQDLFASALPQRLIYVMGAEGEGMDRSLADACDLRLSIPGSGAVESLNVAAATAVFLAQWRG